MLLRVVGIVDIVEIVDRVGSSWQQLTVVSIRLFYFGIKACSNYYDK